MAKKPPSWSKEFDTLIRAIGECKSKAEEDAIITREVELLKPRLKDPRLEKRSMKELLVRLIYVEMLGHDASWAHVKALQACSDSHLLTKKVAYLASTLFLDHRADTIILVVNTLQSDLKSDNYLVVCTALFAVCKLINADLINAVLPKVVELLNHPKEIVRKKAVMALHRFQQLDPKHEGPMHGVDLDRHFRQMLCDKDPSVMAAALCALHDAASHDPRPYRNLVPSFVSILKQVSEHRLPKTYDYHRTPAPFIQIKLLQILALLGVGDRAASENCYAVIAETMRRGNTGHTIGNAIVYECVRTIATIFPSPPLLQSAAEMISSFLRSPGHNLKYVGIESLSRIVKVNAKYAAEHQLAVIDCLEDPDVTLKKKTLELLYKMTRPDNVEVIVEKMVEYLRSTTDEVAKADVCGRISELAESYAPDTTWFIHTMNQVFELGGDVVQPQLAHNLMRLIAEGTGEDDEEADAGLRQEAVESYLQLLDKPKLPQILLKVIAWVLGEYGHTASCGAEEVMDRLAAIDAVYKVDDSTRGYVLSALAKLAAHARIPLTAEAKGLLTAALTSRNNDLQQRALEVQALTSVPASVQAGVLPEDASCEDLEVDPGLGFLSWFVQQALVAGAAPYISEDQRISLGVVRESAADQGPSSVPHSAPLRFAAYETALPPASQPAAAAGVPASAAIDTAGAAAMGGYFDALDGIASAAAVAAAAPSSGQAEAAAAAGGGGIGSSSAIRVQGGARKWGPARYDASPSPPTSAPAQPSMDARPGSAMSAPQQHQAYEAAAPAAEIVMPAEKQRLAQSLFGGGGTGRSGAVRIRAGASRSPAAASPPPTAGGVKAQTTKPLPNAMDLLLLDLDAPADAAAEAANNARVGAANMQAAKSLDPFAALEGLDVSVAPAPAPIKAPPPGPQAINLDALMGNAPSFTGAPHVVSMLPGNPAMPMGFSQQQPGMPGIPSMGMPGMGMLPPGMGGGPVPPMGGVALLGGGGMMRPAAASMQVQQQVPQPAAAQKPKEPDPFADLWK